jgi:hypothetical protein
MTWLFHLVGDIHQPLHCVAMFSEHLSRETKAARMRSSALGRTP